MKDWSIINVEKIIDGDDIEISFMYNLIHGYIMNKTKQNEELSNNIFLKIVKQMDKYDSERSKIHNFIFTICKNEISSFYRLKNDKHPKIDYVENEWVFVQNEIQEEYQENEFYLEKLEKIYQIISKEDKDFMLDYLSNKELKSEKQRIKFFNIKKFIKSNI